MNPTRVERVQRQILREIAHIIQEELKDPRIGFITMTHAQVSPDLRYAKIFVSILGNHQEQENTWNALMEAESFVRSRIWKRMRLRFSPKITFVRDQSAEHMEKISQLLKEIKIKSSVSKISKREL